MVDGEDDFRGLIHFFINLLGSSEVISQNGKLFINISLKGGGRNRAESGNGFFLFLVDKQHSFYFNDSTSLSKYVHELDLNRQIGKYTTISI